MFDNIEIFAQARAMAAHAGARQSLLAANIANADTPGYKPVDLAAFGESYRTLASAPELRATRPAHLGGAEATLRAAGLPSPVVGATSPNGNGVSIEAEMVKAAEVRAQHDLALSIYQSALGILRSSAGRGR